MGFEQVLKRYGLDGGSLRLAYLLGREQGRRFLRGALIFPGIRMADLERVSARTGDELGELVAKRDLMVDSIVDFLEEFLDLDTD